MMKKRRRKMKMKMKKGWMKDEDEEDWY